jgi:hypothetical protein
MSAQVILGKAMFTIRGADHLHVEGELVQIQRSSPTGYETVAVAGEDLLVSIEPAECAKVELRELDEANGSGKHGHPVGVPPD